MIKAVFLDRDDTLTVKYGYTFKLKDFKLHKGVIKGLKLLKGFKFFVVTNQSGIGLGIYTEKQMHAFNKKLLQELSKHGIKIEKIYFCPHTPEENCKCRKPKIGMIKQAKKEFNINLKESFFIGDSDRDVGAGKNAGCKTIFLKTDWEPETKPNFVANNFLEAAQWITK